MPIFKPEFRGVFESSTMPPDILDRVARRVTVGLFSPGDKSRANYRIVDRIDNRLLFCADDLWTAIAVGLNRVMLEQTAPNRIAYHVTFWRWLAYVVVMGGVLGALLVSYYLASPRRQFAGVTGMTFLAMIIFWCVVWPWLLAAMHKRAARRALERVLRQECGMTE